MILKPLFYLPMATKKDREKVREYIRLYGKNPSCYLAVEDDKKYFFGTTVEGVIAYGIVGSVAICACDPICKPEDTVILLSEFITHCKQNDKSVCLCQIMPESVPYLRDVGFGIIKYGEEAMFDLNQYSLAGGKGAKIRNAVNHATKLGISVFEYKPSDHKNKPLDEQIQAVSDEWLESKKSGELSFMLGTVSLQNPLDRRYFVAVDSDQTVLGFIVFVPFDGGKGYMADVTRRRSNAPIGVMEKIMMTAFDTMKKEGVLWGSLGLAPLYNVVNNNDTEQKQFIISILQYIYENMNQIYGFKTLTHYKRKYSPTSWESRYLAYYPNVFTPQIAYSIVKAQNPKGVKDYVLTQLKNIFLKRTVKKESEPSEH